METESFIIEYHKEKDIGTLFLYDPYKICEPIKSYVLDSMLNPMSFSLLFLKHNLI